MGLKQTLQTKVSAEDNSKGSCRTILRPQAPPTHLVLLLGSIAGSTLEKQTKVPEVPIGMERRQSPSKLHESEWVRRQTTRKWVSISDDKPRRRA